MRRIVISYRREDAGGYANHLYDRLTRRLGKRWVFMDRKMRPGVDFPAELRRAIEDADCLLAVIGPHWASVDPGRGTVRLHDPDDWVRIEIEGALRREILVIPLLVGAARLPTRDLLPESLHELLDRNAVEIRDATFADDVDRLANDLAPRTPRTLGLVSALVLFLVSLVGIAVTLRASLESELPAGPPATSAPATSAPATAPPPTLPPPTSPPPTLPPPTLPPPTSPPPTLPYETVQPPVRTPAPTAQRPADFVQAFLALLSGPTTKTSDDAADIASMYAPSVRYFGKGVWTRGQIADDRRRTLSQYDYTSYALDGPVRVRAGDGSEVIVDFRGNYEVHKTRGDEVLCGVFEDRMVLVDVGGRWLIAAHEEDVRDRRRGGDCR